MLKLEVKMPALLGMLPERADLQEAASVNAAERVMELVRDNFLRRGGRRFWRAAADSVKAKYKGRGRAVVSIDHRGVRLRWLGGTVAPKNGRLLAIPAEKGITEYPRAYSNLVFRPVRRAYPHLRGLLVEGTPGTAARKWKDRPAGRPILRADGRLMFRLVDETQHAADPTVLPTDEQLNATIQDAAAEAIKKLTIDH